MKFFHLKEANTYPTAQLEEYLHSVKGGSNYITEVYDFFSFIHEKIFSQECVKANFKINLK